MPNFTMSEMQVSEATIGHQVQLADIVANDSSLKMSNRRKKDSDSIPGSAKKRVKIEEEDAEKIAVEALAFMFAGSQPSSTKSLLSESMGLSLPSPLAQGMSDVFSHRNLLSNKPIRAAFSTTSLTDLMHDNSISIANINSLQNLSKSNSSGSLVSNHLAGSATVGQNSMSLQALTDADRVISGAPSAMALSMPKKPKSASADIYVPLCRAFFRTQLSAAQLYGPKGNDFSLPLPQPLTVEFILSAASKYENFSPSTISSWRSALQNPVEAANFIESLMFSRDTAVKVVFSLMQCALYVQTPEGLLAWQQNHEQYRNRFQHTLLKVVEHDSVRDEAKNQSLLATLPLAYFCVLRLMPRLGLRDNLCLFLALISCLEGRGKYHGRAGDNLPFAHKCYRYLVEVLGGKVFKDIPEAVQSKADKELLRLFELHESAPVSATAPTATVSSSLSSGSSSSLLQHSSTFLAYSGGNNVNNNNNNSTGSQHKSTILSMALAGASASTNVNNNNNHHVNVLSVSPLKQFSSLSSSSGSLSASSGSTSGLVSGTIVTPVDLQQGKKDKDLLSLKINSSISASPLLSSTSTTVVNATNNNNSNDIVGHLVANQMLNQQGTPVDVSSLKHVFRLDDSSNNNNINSSVTVTTSDISISQTINNSSDSSRIPHNNNSNPETHSLGISGDSRASEGNNNKNNSGSAHATRVAVSEQQEGGEVEKGEEEDEDNRSSSSTSAADNDAESALTTANATSTVVLAM